MAGRAARRAWGQGTGLAGAGGKEGGAGGPGACGVAGSSLVGVACLGMHACRAHLRGCLGAGWLLTRPRHAPAPAQSGSLGTCPRGTRCCGLPIGPSGCAALLRTAWGWHPDHATTYPCACCNPVSPNPVSPGAGGDAGGAASGGQGGRRRGGAKVRQPGGRLPWPGPRLSGQQLQPGLCGVEVASRAGRGGGLHTQRRR